MVVKGVRGGERGRGGGGELGEIGGKQQVYWSWWGGGGKGWGLGEVAGDSRFSDAKCIKS